MSRQPSSRPKVLAYYFPDYHRDARNAGWFGEGWDEWRLVRAATPRFDGHYQPRTPALGYTDEADPAVMSEQIRLGSEHGIDGFIFDYYWYDDGPYLQRALDEGFLRADNPTGFEFSIMWANHDLLDIFPRKDLAVVPRTLESGAIGRGAFERMARHVASAYFPRAEYTRIDGRPRFSIYEVGAFVRGLGGVAEATDALRWFNSLARELGHPGIHFDAVVWGFSVLPQEIPIEDPESLLAILGFASASSYVWIHHLDSLAQEFPRATNWLEVGETAFAAYQDYHDRLPVPFHPNVTAGWDASPRVAATTPFTQDHLPYPPAWDTSVEEFEAGLRLAADFAGRNPATYREVTINAWNEWTEGSYLLPDERDGLGKLEAVRRVFGPRERQV
jgi:hypothetical protein